MDEQHNTAHAVKSGPNGGGASLPPNERRCVYCNAVLELVFEAEWDPFEEIYVNIGTWLCPYCGCIHEEERLA